MKSVILKTIKRLNNFATNDSRRLYAENGSTNEFARATDGNNLYLELLSKSVNQNVITSVTSSSVLRVVILAKDTFLLTQISK